ncbi:probable E3 ubiquitin-protein ligase ARI2 isoform X3 [Ananas comosus]|uniref:RBR-type E3 ubiquitin transferase n=1 Tax=Ananas comosus TaxID=4615 RepID=A0A6P5FQA3_ANACO|nr:probable E3 ubiquitin-protein ligase ARI2 isoform X3 [Ananas comosus]
MASDDDPASSSDLEASASAAAAAAAEEEEEEEEEEEDAAAEEEESETAEEAEYYFSDNDDAAEETVLDVLADGGEEECHWSVSSVRVITKESLLAAQREDLRKVMELLALREQHARTLLIHYRWDVERIFELLEVKGRERLFLEAGVSAIENKGRVLSSSPCPITCNVCFDEVPPSRVSEMDCGHCFCNECWTEHFIIKINDGQSRRITCMAPKCNAVCDEAIVRYLVSARHPEIADRFDRFLLESYIEDNNKVKWCPSVPHCGNAIRVKGDICCEVACACGIQFCFSCLSEAHSPCSCLMWELWIKKCQDESETVNWITVNTKHCPKCHKPVEKNGGCNLVACLCGQAFCWLCGGATGRDHTWSSISGHSCGRFKEDQEKRTEQARRNLYRYMHYHNRYKAHIDSLKQETNLKETIQGKISISENKESKIKDYSWVTNGLNRLFWSRRVLAYSYPFAFYMFGDELFKDEMTPQEREMKQNLFEDQQQQLEANVERLSSYLEKDFQDFSDDLVMDTMSRVINLSNVVDRLCKQMYQCIENDLLYPLRTTHNIAPYKSKGLEKPSEVSICWDSCQSSRSTRTCQEDRCPTSESTANGVAEKTVLGKRSEAQLQGSSSSNNGGYSSSSSSSSRKRDKIDARTGPTFDLNMPP